MKYVYTAVLALVLGGCSIFGGTSTVQVEKDGVIYECTVNDSNNQYSEEEVR